MATKGTKSVSAITNERMSAAQFRAMHSLPIHPPSQRMTASQYLASLATGEAVTVSAGGARVDKSGVRSRRNKYGNTKVGEFDSSKEARVCEQLKMQMMASNPSERVTSIEHHVRFEVIPKQDGERASHYEADFVVHYADGRMEVIDVKSEVTRKEARYVLKRKLMLHVHGIRIREV